MNVNIFEFNRQFDRYVLKPVAKGYNFVMPDWVQVGISNIYYQPPLPSALSSIMCFRASSKGPASKWDGSWSTAR